MTRCYDCQNYLNLTTKRTGGGVQFSREQFITWKRSSPERRKCSYCGIDSAGLQKLGAVNVRTKRPYESIGVDRLDNSKPYTLDNIVPCCGACNAIKGSILTDAEMREVGKVLAKLWTARVTAEHARSHVIAVT
jgi:5-methylcytosine-specific restriction endonuclease McrA